MSDITDLSRIADALEDLAETTATSGPLPSYLLAYAALVVAAAGVFFGRQQLVAIKNQIQAENDRQKRSHALTVLKNFNDGMKREYDMLSWVVNELNDEEIEALVDPSTDDRKVKVPQNYRTVLQNSLSQRLKAEYCKLTDSNEYLSDLQRDTLQSICEDFVNHLENALLSVSENVADKVIVMNQLEPYFSEEMIERMDRLWRAFGNNKLPFTLAVLDERKELREPVLDWRERREMHLKRLNELRTH